MLNVVAMIPDIGDGTSYYRGAGPLSQLVKKKEISVTYPEMFNWATLAGCDVVFMQRPHNLNHLNVFNMAKDMGKPVVLDYDDDLFSLHPCNAAYNLYEDRTTQSNIRWMLRHANHIIVSTDHLKSKYEKHTSKPITVVNNAYDDGLQFYVGKKQERSMEMAFWRGGPQHEVDLNTYMNDMVAIINEAKIPWVLLGNPSWQWLFKLSHDCFEHRQTDDVIKYLKSLYQIQPIIGVAPLANIEFNHSKSNIGWIEATISGAAYIGPSHIKEFQKPGIFHYDDKNTIHTIFNSLLDNPDVREKAQKESLEFIQDNLRLSVVNTKRLELLNEYR
jgi:hypothetical protein